MRAVAVIAALVLLAACTGGRAAVPPSGSPAAEGPVVLTVLAAASLRTALEAVVTSYETSHPGTTLIVSTDSSAALATQIEQGAPADVFLSADTTHPRQLADRGLAAGDQVAFAGNTLILIVPATNPGHVDDPTDLARVDVRVIAARDEVPITAYAKEVVANLASLPGYPADFVAAYEANVVSREDNVAAVAARIALGEGDAGLVYTTDAAAAAGVTAIELPGPANVSATYAGVVIRESAQRAAAASFLDWLAGPDGQAVLSSFGFRSPT